MKNRQQVEKFVKTCFELYSVSGEGFFYTTDSEGEGIQKPLFDGNNDNEVVEKIADLLCVTAEDIVECNTQNVCRLAEQYPFFELIRLYYDAMFVFEGQKKLELEIDEDNIKDRLIKELKNANEKFAGVYHANAEIKDLRVDTAEMYSFSDLQRLLKSMIKMLEECKETFIKALYNDLTKEEANKYNLMANVLKIVDMGGSKSEPMTYEKIVKYREIYKQEYEKYNDYNYVVKSNLISLLNFTPWECVEFLEDKEVAQKIIELFPYCDIKNELKRFANLCGKYSCFYHWSDKKYLTDEEIDLLEDDDELDGNVVEQYYVHKTEEEMREFASYIGILRKWAGCKKLGGLIKATIPEYLLNDGVTFIQRVNARLAVKGDK